MSVTTRSKRPPSTSRAAYSGYWQHSAETPARRHMAATISSCRGSSSTSSARSGGSGSAAPGSGAAVRPAAPSAASPTGTVTMNLLPWPGALSSEIAPPSSFTRRSTIDSPSPKPSTPCAERSRTNSAKICSRSSGPIPRPVSRTEKTSCPSERRARSVTTPSSVNFKALESRLSAICRIRKASPATSRSVPGASSSRSSSPLAAAAAANPARIVSKSCAGLKATASTSILLASRR